MRCIYCIILSICITANAGAQDSTKHALSSMSLFDTSRKISVIKKITVDTVAKKDTLVKKAKHDPHKATIRSAIIPGWGQAYNREYWKIPIVYAAIGIPIGTYIYNNTWYKRTRDAYTIVINNDTANFSKINPKLFYNGSPLDASSLQNYRNQFRRDQDYSLLVIFIAWGLNIVDATVFGNLKDFDVSDDLSMHVNPGYNPVTKATNLGFVFNFKPHHQKLINTSW